MRCCVLHADEQDNVQLIENAPYGDIVTKLGEASIGLNTMQDEHFGINVVEFMVSLYYLLKDGQELRSSRQRD